MSEIKTPRLYPRYRVLRLSLRMHGKTGFVIVRICPDGHVAHLPMRWSDRQAADELADLFNEAAQYEKS